MLLSLKLFLIVIVDSGFNILLVDGSSAFLAAFVYILDILFVAEARTLIIFHNWPFILFTLIFLKFQKFKFILEF